MATITNVAWVQDHHGRPALELDLDGHAAHIGTSQRTELLQRGIVEGMVFFASERSAHYDNAFVRGAVGPSLTQADLIGCTDDPDVFALFEEMSRAILGGTWRPGMRVLAA